MTVIAISRILQVIAFAAVDALINKFAIRAPEDVDSIAVAHGAKTEVGIFIIIGGGEKVAILVVVCKIAEVRVHGTVIDEGCARDGSLQILKLNKKWLGGVECAAEGGGVPVVTPPFIV